ncbi:MAG TPA: 4-(cytidine 5'-diphospho)-2-C-methyl-D-erythritol kinase [Pyrinomonadaceae bacterium]|nr:4-(cytidine 5'-diphospho)-2-C-methyl-D-erythritol kinase [Pyrinomonadaceae bacterium]
MTKTSLKLPSFAKINWFLRILGKRPDAYHEVVTVLQTISLCDEITFNVDGQEGPIRLTCDDPEIPIDNTNLIIQAANALSGQHLFGYGAEITLTKRIPAQGGLGGASSNAAITLMALNALWRGSNFITMDSALLGADVPFFLWGGRCLATGTGTKISPLPDGPEQHLIVVTPNAKVSTANAYASLNAASLTTSESDSILSSSLADVSSADSRQWPLRNDFERVIFEIEPEIERAKMALLEAGARGALLAGSGSSVFGVFEDEAARNRGLENLRSEAGWKVFSCHTLSRAEYSRAMNSSGLPLITLS